MRATLAEIRRAKGIAPKARTAPVTRDRLAAMLAHVDPGTMLEDGSHGAPLGAGCARLLRRVSLSRITHAARLL
jgi:hypothetical protein